MRLLFHAAPSRDGAPGSGGARIPSDLTTCPSDKSRHASPCSPSQGVHVLRASPRPPEVPQCSQVLGSLALAANTLHLSSWAGHTTFPDWAVNSLTVIVVVSLTSSFCHQDRGGQPIVWPEACPSTLTLSPPLHLGPGKPSSALPSFLLSYFLIFTFNKSNADLFPPVWYFSFVTTWST